jgi:hypothetical protein
MKPGISASFPASPASAARNPQPERSGFAGVVGIRLIETMTTTKDEDDDDNRRIELVG